MATQTPKPQTPAQTQFRELVLEVNNNLHISAVDDCRIVNMPFMHPTNPIRLLCGSEERDWGGFSDIIDAITYLLPRVSELVILLPTRLVELRFIRRVDTQTT